MLHKILKIELLALFVVTILAFAAFYFQGSLPDNAYSISSQSESVGWMSYSFFSLVASFGYYLGPWVFFPFILTAFIYGFVNRTRDCAWDLLTAPLLFTLFLTSGHYLYPDFLGRGLFILLDEYASDFGIITTMLFCFFGIFLVTFRGSFFEIVLSSAQELVSWPKKMFVFVVQLSPLARFKKSVESMNQTLIDFRVNTRNLLRGERAERPQLGPSKKPLPTAENFYPKATTLKKESSEPVDSKPSRVKDFLFKQATTKDSSPSEEDVSSAKSSIESEVVAPSSSSPKRGESPKTYEEYKKIVQHFAQKERAIENNHPDDQYFHDIIQRIEEKLADFGIDGKIINILKGPVVDTFELETGPGVKVSKINGIQDDLTMALMGAPIRIVYPMPQKTTIGIEVPRNPRDVIFLHEVLQSDDFSDTNARLPVAMGKNAFGETFVVDLASMPHMLVAGATGAGKSVFINTLLVSLLVKKSPQQMKLILIDPKQLELALYSSLPHLAMPVLTDPKKSAIALLWAVEEMERRYGILKDCGVRNIEGFNKKIANANPALLAKIRDQYQNDPDREGYELPYLVIIVDEFADLVLTKAGKDIEQYICRLAAKARAAGIHLVLATQRPSVDVVTGLIKSNFPTRVSFRVTTNADSRTILDSIGAEKLLGKGDMLYRNGTETTRVHSSYVDEEEIEVLVEQLAEMPGTYSDGAMEFLENGGPQESSDEFSFGSHLSSSLSSGGSGDDLFDQAVRVVVEHRSASASMLQRRLKIGYNRAANLIDELESKGIVGPAQGAKPRSVIGGQEADL